MAEKDIQSLVESAYAEAETASAGAVADQAAGVSGGDEPSAPDVDAGASASDGGGGTGDAPLDGDGVAAAAQRARDKAGRFAPKGKDAPQVAPRQAGAATGPAVPGSASPIEAGAAPVEPPPVAAPAHKAPQSWTPAEREHFAKAPPEVQAAVARREREAAMALQEAAPDRRLAQEARQALAPYQQFAQSIGQTPLSLAQQASQVALQISTAPPHIAAKVFADLIRSRPDIQLELINGHLSEQPQAAGPAQLDSAAIIRQAKEEFARDLGAQRQQRLQAQFEQEVSAFAADPANEFFGHEEHGPEVQRRVLGLIQATSHLPPGKQPALADIYQEAVMAYGPTRAIMQKRADVERAKATTASTQQARLAASSVKSAPSTGASSLRTPKTDRERVEAAYDTVFGG